MTIQGKPSGAVTIRADFGTVELVPDPSRPESWMLLLDRCPQSYVDLSDPRHLRFEYVRSLASIVDCVAPPGASIRALHLGGGGLTFPRYVAATRPESSQRVIERDAALMALVRRVLPLPRWASIRVRITDAREAVESSLPRRYDLVVADVLNRTGVPARLTSVEFAKATAQALTQGGQYALNFADSAPFYYARGLAATLRAVFADVCLIVESDVLGGDRIGNLVLAATNGKLPESALAECAARDPTPMRLLHKQGLDRFVRDAQPLTDADAADSPQIPSEILP